MLLNPVSLHYTSDDCSCSLYVPGRRSEA